MKKLFALIFFLPTFAFTQPVVDGQGGDPCYKVQGSFSGSNGTFGDWGVKEVQACTQNQTLYVFVKGAVNPTNYHDILVFINASDKTGIPAGTAGEIPAGNDGLSPFHQYAFPITNPIETDYGVRLTADAANLKGYVSHINYTGTPSNLDVYLGEVTYGGASVTYSEITFAHVQAASMSTATGGFEFSIPYSKIGAGAGAQFQLYAVYGNEQGQYAIAPGIIQTPLFSGTATATERDELPNTAALEVYPNPFNPEATARFSVPITQPVEVALYNALGQRLKTLYAGTALSGQIIEAKLHGNDLQSGVYYLKMTGTSILKTRAVSLLK
ncbi:MAG TPA: T9SS type A sorting domain-containing protein [Rhodothermales bacterium]|nr:T9SS type A sorting domain-containing protein [Rhodothermales bacterium]HRR08175.1 T9SS type A sorting domain-containing protein [Rhodothermales bacterium]